MRLFAHRPKITPRGITGAKHNAFMNTSMVSTPEAIRGVDIIPMPAANPALEIPIRSTPMIGMIRLK